MVQRRSRSDAVQLWQYLLYNTLQPADSAFMGKNLFTFDLEAAYFRRQAIHLPSRFPPFNLQF